jgi:hypothetical protein
MKGEYSMHVTCPNSSCRRRVKISRNAVCKCRKQLFYTKNQNNISDVYLIDANIAYNASKKHSEVQSYCQLIITHPKVATTRQVFDEFKHRFDDMQLIYEIKDITNEVKQLYSSFKNPCSENDLSLIQAAIDNPEIIGIITYDGGFKAIASSGIITSKRKTTGADFFVGNAQEFLKKFHYI